MIDLLVWGAARAWQKWKTPKPEIIEGSVEDLSRLKDVVDALYEDTQRLIDATRHQQEQIDLLRRQIGGTFVLLIIAFIAIICLTIRH